MNKYYKLLLIIPLFVVSCVDFPEDPLYPSWDIELNAPLIDTVYYLDEIIKVDENIKIDSTSGIGVYFVESDSYDNTFGVSEFVRNQLNGQFLESVPVLTGDSLIGIGITSGAEVDSAHLKTGMLTVSVKNNSSETVNFSVGMPKFKDEDGNIFSFEGTIDANGNYNNSFDLANFQYGARDQDNKSELLFLVDSKPSNPSNETLDIDITLSQTDFYFIEGKLPTKKVKDISELVELPLTDDVKELKGKIEFTNAQMIITADYISEFEEIFTGEFQNFQIQGRNSEGETMYLTNPDGTNNLGNLLIDDGKLERVYDNTNSNISEFLSFMPDEVLVISEVFLNPTEERGIATDKDSINVSMKILSSSEIRINEVTMNDTLDFEIEEDIRKEILNGRLAEIVYDIENAIPVEHEMTLTFLDKNKNILMVENQPFRKNIELPGADILDENKNYSPESIKEKFVLSEEEIYKLAEAYFIVLDWKAYTDQKPLVAFFSDEQYFRIKTYCSAIYNVNPN